MNELKTREEKMTRFFSIIGFIVLVVLLAWLAVQFVRVLPTAFTSLANIFEDNQRELREKTEDDPKVVVVDDTEDNPTDEDDWSLPEDEAEVSDDVDESDTNDESDETETVDTTPQYVTIETYVVPQNDPNGYTDFEVSLIAVGAMTSNDRFVAGEALKKGDRGAIQFRVKNIGTKTSGSWDFSTQLPDGTVMDSQIQPPLGPSEIAILTIAFDAISTGTKTFGVTTHVSDTNSTNNSFSGTVHIGN